MSNFYLESFKTFFKIGLFTLGGGYAMIPIIESEVVDKHKWVGKEDFIDMIAIAQSCPGVMAINISAFIGYRLRKVKGALCMALGTALPSFLIILAIAMFFHQFEDNKVVAAIFRGIRPRRGSADSRTDVQHGKEREDNAHQLLDTYRLRAGNLDARRVPDLRHPDSWSRRICVREVY